MIKWYEDIVYGNSVTHLPHFKCSECGKEFDSYASQFMKYCSNCGKKMDGSQEFVDNINHPTQNLIINKEEK